MRVIPLTSVLSHKGSGCRCPKRNDTLSLEVKELIKHALRGSGSWNRAASALFLVISIGAISTGCGSTPAPTPELKVNPEAILEQAIGQLDQLSYASFSLE